MTAPRDVDPRVVDVVLWVVFAAMWAAAALIALVAMWGGLPSQQPTDTFTPQTVAPAVVYRPEEG